MKMTRIAFLNALIPYRWTQLNTKQLNLLDNKALSSNLILVPNYLSKHYFQP